MRRQAISDMTSAVVKFTTAEFESEKARERRLKRQATQGVVALFNAVKQHQSLVDGKLDSSGPLYLQKEKVITGYSASDFLDRLSTGLPAKPKSTKLDLSDTDVTTKKRKIHTSTCEHISFLTFA